MKQLPSVSMAQPRPYRVLRPGAFTQDQICLPLLAARQNLVPTPKRSGLQTCNRMSASACELSLRYLPILQAYYALNHLFKDTAVPIPAIYCDQTLTAGTHLLYPLGQALFEIRTVNNWDSIPIKRPIGHCVPLGKVERWLPKPMQG